MGLGNELKTALGVNIEKKSVKLTEAPTIRKKDIGSFNVPIKYGMLQADLIYIKEESQGFKYILTVVDVASRKMDAIPLKGRTHNDVIGGFVQVWKNGHIEKDRVRFLYTDSGSEFKNKVFQEYMDDHDIIVRYTMTARKNQTGIVEYYNYIITKHIGQKITSKDREDGKDYSDWADDLKKIVEVLNQKKYEKESKISDFIGQPKVNTGEKLLQEGTLVHVRLQQPIDHNVDYKKARLHGGFRSGDLRWEKQTTRISNVVIHPNQPIRYMVTKYKNVSFIRKELLVADEQTPEPAPEPVPNPQPEAPPEVPPEDAPVSSRTRSAKNALNSKYPNMI
jgi:hypothetical protein